MDELHGRDGRVIARETIAFLVDAGMDEALLPSREDAAAA